MSNLRRCQGCGEDHFLRDFPVRNDRSGRPRPYCKYCQQDAQRARYRHHKKNNPFGHRCSRARVRAKGLGVPFDLDKEYLESLWTGRCPVLGFELSLDTDRRDESAAELDRFNPSLGYVKGNVHWLSRRANRIKNNVSKEELKLLLDWMENV